MKKKNILLYGLLFLFVVAVQAQSSCKSARYKRKYKPKNKCNGVKKDIKTVKVRLEKEGKKMENAYSVKENLKPMGLAGISDEQINDHWKLYEGYVKQVNTLNQELKTLEVGSLVYADRRRRYGFEYNGMVLHEYYFENLTSRKKELTGTSTLKKVIIATWGSFDAWKADFIAAGKTRGIGWAILYCDPTTKRLTNNFIAEHQNGNIAGYKPLLVMDVWEHAYMVDHSAGGRGAYIDAFLQNIDWEVVQGRFDSVLL